MKWILFVILISIGNASASTYIGNGGQAGDVELAVSMKQIRAAIERIRVLRVEDPNFRVCSCPEAFYGHNLCDTIQQMNVEQQNYCEKFVHAQLDKLDRAAVSTQFEWVKSEMVNRNSVGDRIVDAVARKDRNMIYIDQSRFLSLDETKRMFLVVHELFHMDTFDGKKLDDEEKIGPFNREYGIRDLLNSAAASITLTSIVENVFDDYTKYLKQSRSTAKHWIGLSSLSSAVQEKESSNFSTTLNSGTRFSYQYQFESPYNLGLTVMAGSTHGGKTIFETANITQTQNSSAIGLTYRYFLFSNLDPFSHFWNTFIQFELLHETISSTFKMYETLTSLSSSANSSSVAARINLFIPMKHGFWLNTGIHFSQHQLHFKEFDYTLTSNSPSLFLGVTYGF